MARWEERLSMGKQPRGGGFPSRFGVPGLADALGRRTLSAQRGAMGAMDAFPGSAEYDLVSFGYAAGSPSPLLSSNPRVSPMTAQAAVELGYDPNLANASLPLRAGALLLDGAIYAAAVTFLALLAWVGFGEEPAQAITIAASIAGPLGFYLYRAAGDAIFEGSPGKHMLGLRMSGPHGIPVSARDGLVRNAWLLPSMIPFLGWVVTAGIAGWIGVSALRDPLGRGSHELRSGTRVEEKPDRELGR